MKITGLSQDFMYETELTPEHDERVRMAVTAMKQEKKYIDQEDLDLKPPLEEVVREYLELPPKKYISGPGGVASQQMHIFGREMLSYKGSPAARFFYGMNPELEVLYFTLFVTARDPLATESQPAKSDTVFPMILKALCSASIQSNSGDDPNCIGRPTRITASDYNLVRYIKDNFGSGATVEYLKESAYLVPAKLCSPSTSPSEPRALNAFLDTFAAHVNRGAQRTMDGEPFIVRECEDGTLERVSTYPPVPKASYRKSKSSPGEFRSNVEKELRVPPSLNFCQGCDKLKLSSEMKECSRCKVVKYCSRDCQKHHWKRKDRGHKQECRVLSKETSS